MITLRWVMIKNKPQLSLRMISVGAGASGELQTVEAEAMNYEGNPIKEHWQL